MRLDITRQYPDLFRKTSVRRLLPFAREVLQSGKLRELSSFVVWEALHQLRLFPKDRYMQFANGDALTVRPGTLGRAEFHHEVSEFFERRGLSAKRCPNNWKLLVADRNNDTFGALYPKDCDLYRSPDPAGSPTFLKRFPGKIASLFVSSQNTIFVCIRGAVYRSTDSGASFHKSLDFASGESFFRFNNGMTETPDKLLVMGEYANVWDERGWRRLAYLYFSSDDGETWESSDFLIQKGTNKHVHAVMYSKNLDRLLVSDGDNHKRLWISGPAGELSPETPQLTAVNRFHIQMGGYTSVLESEGTILLGTDYQGGTNFLVETTDGAKYTRWIVPDPYRRSPIDNMVSRQAANGTEIWANLPFSTGGTKSLLMYSADGQKTWHRVIEYDSVPNKVWLLNSSQAIPSKLYFSIHDLKSNDRVVYEIADQPS